MKALALEDVVPVDDVDIEEAEDELADGSVPPMSLVPPEDQRPELLRPMVMAALLGVSRATLRGWRQLPGFPVISAGRHMVLYPWRRVVEYVELMAGAQTRAPSRADIPRKRTRTRRPRPMPS
jgi:hypothetical protein